MVSRARRSFSFLRPLGEDAADALLFNPAITIGDEARAALDRLDELVETLVERDRITPELGEVLRDAVESCGPQRAAA